MHVLDITKPHQRFFEEITRIPHGTYHERAISDYLECFAVERGLRYHRDPVNNIVIYKPASPGYEQHPPLALQAHMDMVCVKDPDSRHDFLTDPLPIFIDNGVLRAKGTTLGADDGMGVAYILALLDDQELVHPPLEGIFTVQEEVGHLGSAALDPSVITARRLISLDCGGGDKVYRSSYGRQEYTLTCSLQTQNMQSDEQGYRISVKGLLGGYSRAYLKHAQNAISLCARLLCRISQCAEIRLAAFCGGGDEEKIAATCESVFLSSAPFSALQTAFEDSSSAIKAQIADAEPSVTLSLEPCAAESAVSAEESARLLSLLRELPVGLIAASRTPGMFAAVNNWRGILLENRNFSLKCTIRAEDDAQLTQLIRTARAAATRYALEYTVHNYFPSWHMKPDSALFQQL